MAACPKINIMSIIKMYIAFRFFLQGPMFSESFEIEVNYHKYCYKRWVRLRLAKIGYTLFIYIYYFNQILNQLRFKGETPLTSSTHLNDAFSLLLFFLDFRSSNVALLHDPPIIFSQVGA